MTIPPTSGLSSHWAWCSCLSHFIVAREITFDPCNPIGSHRRDLFYHFMLLIASLSQPMRHLYQNTTTNQFQTCLKKSFKLQGNERQLLHLFTNQLNNIVLQTENCIKRVIEFRVVQFWLEIILLISNHVDDFRPNCTQCNYHNKSDEKDTTDK